MSHEATRNALRAVLTKAADAEAARQRAMRDGDLERASVGGQLSAHDLRRQFRRIPLQPAQGVGGGGPGLAVDIRNTSRRVAADGLHRAHRLANQRVGVGGLAAAFEREILALYAQHAEIEARAERAA